MSKTPRRRATSATTGRISYHPNEDLAKVIVEAWSNPQFRDELLTFSGGKGKSGELRSEKLARTKAALEKAGIFLDNSVVLTPKEHAEYRVTGNETIFVLPDPIGPIGKPSLQAARIAMAGVVAGI